MTTQMTTPTNSTQSTVSPKNPIKATKTNPSSKNKKLKNSASSINYCKIIMLFVVERRRRRLGLARLLGRIRIPSEPTIMNSIQLIESLRIRTVVLTVAVVLPTSYRKTPQEYP